MSLCDPMDYTVHGILQARILEWVAFPFSRRSSQTRDWTQVSRITSGLFTSWATREAKTVQETWAYFCPWTLCPSWQGSGLKPSWLSEDPNESLWPTSYSSLGKLYHSSWNEHYRVVLPSGLLHPRKSEGRKLTFFSVGLLLCLWDPWDAKTQIKMDSG